MYFIANRFSSGKCIAFVTTLISFSLLYSIFSWLSCPQHYWTFQSYFVNVPLFGTELFFLVFRLCLFGRNTIEVTVCGHCVLSHNIQFWFVPLPVMSTLIIWLASSRKFTLFSFHLLSILWGDTLKLFKWAIPHQISIYPFYI